MTCVVERNTKKAAFSFFWHWSKMNFSKIRHSFVAFVFLLTWNFPFIEQQKRILFYIGPFSYKNNEIKYSRISNNMYRNKSLQWILYRIAHQATQMSRKLGSRGRQRVCCWRLFPRTQTPKSIFRLIPRSNH